MARIHSGTPSITSSPTTGQKRARYDSARTEERPRAPNSIKSQDDASATTFFTRLLKERFDSIDFKTVYAGLDGPMRELFQTKMLEIFGLPRNQNHPDPMVIDELNKAFHHGLNTGYSDGYSQGHRAGYNDCFNLVSRTYINNGPTAFPPNGGEYAASVVPTPTAFPISGRNYPPAIGTFGHNPVNGFDNRNYIAPVVAPIGGPVIVPVGSFYHNVNGATNAYQNQQRFDGLEEVRNQPVAENPFLEAPKLISQSPTTAAAATATPSPSPPPRPLPLLIVRNPSPPPPCDTFNFTDDHDTEPEEAHARFLKSIILKESDKLESLYKNGQTFSNLSLVSQMTFALFTLTNGVLVKRRMRTNNDGIRVYTHYCLHCDFELFRVDELVSGSGDEVILLFKLRDTTPCDHHCEAKNITRNERKKITYKFQLLKGKQPTDERATELVQQEKHSERVQLELDFLKMKNAFVGIDDEEATAESQRQTLIPLLKLYTEVKDEGSSIDWKSMVSSCVEVMIVHFQGTLVPFLGKERITQSINALTKHVEDLLFYIVLFTNTEVTDKFKECFDDSWTPQSLKDQYHDVIRQIIKSHELIASVRRAGSIVKATPKSLPSADSDGSTSSATSIK